MGLAKAFGALTLLFALSACGRDAALDRLPGGRQAAAVQAISGDLVLLAGEERVRLAGIEAPAADQPYGAQSQAALHGLIADRKVELLFGGARQDPFGRTAAQLRRTDDRLWIEGAMLRSGAARVRTFPDNRALAELMLTEEARARIAGKGLWALPAYRVLLPGEVPPDADGFHIVEGRVLRVNRAAGRTYLDFARDWRGAFSADIAPAAMREFALAQIDPLTLEGKLVRIRGSVRPTGNGPRMRLDHPEQVERLNEPKSKTPGG